VVENQATGNVAGWFEGQKLSPIFTLAVMATTTFHYNQTTIYLDTLLSA